MSANMQFNGPPGFNVNPYTQPPTASDGYDLYIAKLMGQAGLAPPSWHQDSFEKAGVLGAQRSNTFADKLLKGAGIAFAIALSLVGLRHFAGKAAQKAAGTAAKATQT